MVQAVLEILADRLKADTFRCHDPLVLQLLDTSLGYESLFTDFGHALQGSLLGLYTVLPPKERVELNCAKDKGVSF